ncbi:hypothetical protein [Chitinophaga lutea]
MTNLPAHPDFTLTLTASDWRQSEFINIQKLCRVGEEMDEIKDVRINHSKEALNGDRLFHRLYIRSQVGSPELFIPLFELKTFLRSHEIGSIAMENAPGFVRQGFALITPAGCYYGLEENGVVKSLGLHDATHLAEREVSRLVRQFSLIYVNWCNCLVVTP